MQVITHLLWLSTYVAGLLRRKWRRRLRTARQNWEDLRRIRYCAVLPLNLTFELKLKTSLILREHAVLMRAEALVHLFWLMPSFVVCRRWWCSTSDQSWSLLLVIRSSILKTCLLSIFFLPLGLLLLPLSRVRSHVLLRHYNTIAALIICTPEPQYDVRYWSRPGLQRETRGNSCPPIRAGHLCFGGLMFGSDMRIITRVVKETTCNSGNWTGKWEVGSKRRRTATRCWLMCSHAAFQGLDPLDCLSVWISVSWFLIISFWL